MSAYNTIVLDGNDALHETYEEARAGGTVKPGHQVIVQADGTVVVGPAAGVLAEAMVVTEECLALLAKNITDSYAATELVSLHLPRTGQRMQLILKAGQNVAVGDYLTPNGDGTQKKWTNEASKLFKCLEALDLSAGGAIDTFIKVRRA